MLRLLFPTLQYDECILRGSCAGRQKWIELPNTSWCLGKNTDIDPLHPFHLLLAFNCFSGWYSLQDLGAIANPMFKLKGPSMIQSSYSPAFPLKHQQKDMRLALALGDENAVPMPVAAAANEVPHKLIHAHLLWCFQLLKQAFELCSHSHYGNLRKNREHGKSQYMKHVRFYFLQISIVPLCVGIQESQKHGIGGPGLFSCAWDCKRFQKFRLILLIWIGTRSIYAQKFLHDRGIYIALWSYLKAKKKINWYIHKCIATCGSFFLNSLWFWDWNFWEYCGMQNQNISEWHKQYRILWLKLSGTNKVQVHSCWANTGNSLQTRKYFSSRTFPHWFKCQIVSTCSCRDGLHLIP